MRVGADAVLFPYVTPGLGRQELNSISLFLRASRSDSESPEKPKKGKHGKGDPINDQFLARTGRTSCAGLPASGPKERSRNWGSLPPGWGLPSCCSSAAGVPNPGRTGGSYTAEPCS